MLRQSIYWGYLTLLVLFSKTCHLNVKCCQREWDAWHETQRGWDIWQGDMYIHAHILTHKKQALHSHEHVLKHTFKSVPVQINMHAPGFLRLLRCFISFSQSQRFFPMFNLWSHYLSTHLSSSKWFLFISCESPNQSWKLNAIQRSHCFQLHSLSLWKWTAAAENSDVLSHRDWVSLNVSYDLYHCCLWLKALVGDSTNHVTHLMHYIWFLYVPCISLPHLLSVSLAYMLLIEIITACWKEHRQRGKYKVSLNLKPVVSSCNGRTLAPRSLIRRELSSSSLDRGGRGGGRRGLEVNVFLLRKPGTDVFKCYCTKQKQQ